MGEVSSLLVGRFMRLPLGDRDLGIASAPGLPAVQEVLAAMIEHVEGRRMPAGALDGTGVTVDRMRAFAVDAAAVWRDGHALVTFRREGDSAAARDRLREALRANRRVAKYLDGAAALPDQRPETCAFGSEEEAVIAARTLAEAWSAPPGAAAWLAAAGGGGRAGSKKRRR